MKITDIVSESSKLSPELTASISNLKKKGWKLIGRGMFGAVMEHYDRPWVLKLFSNNDTAYHEFVNLAQAHPNPHFPTFTGDILRTTRGFSVVRVEKLMHAQSYMKFAHLTGLYMETIDEPLSIGVEKCREYVEAVPSLKIACELIARNLLERFNLDLETKDNVMLRKETFVFSDPVANVLE